LLVRRLIEERGSTEEALLGSLLPEVVLEAGLAKQIQNRRA